MVKHKCNSKYQTTTADLPKISSPEVRDDPFGSSSPRIASGFLYWSDLRGVTSDSPIITFLKFREMPYGLLLSRDASDVSDCADFLLIPLVSLSCYLDLQFSYVLMFDLMTDFVMDLYSLFHGFVEFKASPREIFLDDKLFVDIIWLNLKIERLLTYGCLPRPPECSAVHFCTITLISKNLGSGTVCCGVVQELCTDSKDNFRPQKFSRLGESLKVVIDTCWLDLYQADCYSILHLVSLVCEVGNIGFATFFVADVFKSIHATTIDVRALRLYLFIKIEADCFKSTRHQFQELNSLIQQMEILSERCCFLLAFLYHVKFRFRISADMRSFTALSKISSWLYLHDEEDKDDMRFFFDCQVLLQRQSLDCGFI